MLEHFEHILLLGGKHIRQKHMIGGKLKLPFSVSASAQTKYRWKMKGHKQDRHEQQDPMKW